MKIMKTILFFLAALFAITSLSSCKRDWVCICENNNATVYQGILQYEILKSTKDEAIPVCNNHADSLSVHQGLGEVWNCFL
jgi:hypothetical protein